MATDVKELTVRFLKPRERPQVVYGRTERIKTGCGYLYVTINEDSEGIIEMFLSIGKPGSCAHACNTTTGILLSISLRSGIEPAYLVKKLRGVYCANPGYQDGVLITSCSDAAARVLEGYLKEKESENGTAES